MPKYVIGIREVHVSFREVEAPNEEVAKIQAAGDLDTEFKVEYSHTLDPDTWSVEEKS